MGKLIAKTAFSTFALLIGIVLILFGVLSLAAPSIMISMADDLGLDRLAAAYSVSIYKRTDRISDLADAVERNYYIGEFSECAKYGDKLKSHDDYTAYCAFRDERDSSSEITGSRIGKYDQYVSGLISVSNYKSNNKEKALATVLNALNGSFPKNNAAEYLAIVAIENQDSDFCETFANELRKLTPSSSTEKISLSEFIQLLTKVSA